MLRSSQLKFLLVFLLLITTYQDQQQANSAGPQDPTDTGIDFQFPAPMTGKQLLGQQDSYTRTTSSFDRKVRMRTATDPGEQQYLEFVQAQVIPWEKETRLSLQQAIKNLEPKLAAHGIQLKSPVNLIHTTGKEESGAAYTRGNEIIFPKRIFDPLKPPTKLLAHELFHVISRQHPLLRDELYRIIGFEKANPIELPDGLAHLRITNPDAPVIEHVMKIQLSDDASAYVAPMLIAKSDYNPEGSSSLFAYLSFKLLQVKRESTGWCPDIVDEEPVFHSPKTADFQRQIGRNTGYIIHPEEILADNFALIMTNGKITDRWLTDQMVSKIRNYFEKLPSDDTK